MTFTSEMLTEAQRELNLITPNPELTDPVLATVEETESLHVIARSAARAASLATALFIPMGEAGADLSVQTIAHLFSNAIGIGILIGSKATVCELTPDCTEPSATIPIESFAGVTA